MFTLVEWEFISRKNFTIFNLCWPELNYDSYYFHIECSNPTSDVYFQFWIFTLTLHPNYSSLGGGDGEQFFNIFYGTSILTDLLVRWKFVLLMKIAINSRSARFWLYTRQQHGNWWSTAKKKTRKETGKLEKFFWTAFRWRFMSVKVHSHVEVFKLYDNLSHSNHCLFFYPTNT